MKTKINPVAKMKAETTITAFAKALAEWHSVRAALIASDGTTAPELRGKAAARADAKNHALLDRETAAVWNVIRAPLVHGYEIAHRALFVQALFSNDMEGGRLVDNLTAMALAALVADLAGATVSEIGNY
jgi:hypothetical protein